MSRETKSFLIISKQLIFFPPHALCCTLQVETWYLFSVSSQHVLVLERTLCRVQVPDQSCWGVSAGGKQRPHDLWALVEVRAAQTAVAVVGSIKRFLSNMGVSSRHFSFPSSLESTWRASSWAPWRASRTSSLEMTRCGRGPWRPRATRPPPLWGLWGGPCGPTPFAMARWWWCSCSLGASSLTTGQTMTLYARYSGERRVRALSRCSRGSSTSRGRSSRWPAWPQVAQPRGFVDRPTAGSGSISDTAVAPGATSTLERMTKKRGWSCWTSCEAWAWLLFGSHSPSRAFWEWRPWGHPWCGWLCFSSPSCTSCTGSRMFYILFFWL